MISKEAQVILTDFSRLMWKKIKEPLLYIHGWFNLWIAIAVARSYSLMIQRDFLPIPLRERDPDWELISGLSLVKLIMS